ncbi:uncharacterized protein BYT42DRAFT_618678 [Radiomyces spectabilis]|uniref:uncharacterized protein n=1 Tax=Radiomyces spectabilis TaxID=64574 RepID=UPI002220552A|nr:uncharacterized protein BYT42DRAFT_618678 [Radiomyces spectabilis]KAI8365298.1 hypothetical protein BYT42DRAFT_618678 [Radiomyces spectabilis]
MKATFFLTVAAVLVAAVSAQSGSHQHANGGHRADINQEVNGVGLEGRVSGLLNNLLKGGLLADASQGHHVGQDAF